MISVADAKRCIWKEVISLSEETQTLYAAIGRTVSETIHAPHDLSPFDSSAMDGYGLKWQENEDICAKSYKKLEAIYAGSEAVDPLNDDEVLPIMTGAPVPSCVDVVIQKEWAELQDGMITFTRNPTKLSLNIRRAGEDFKQGDPILEKGTVLEAAQLALLAEFGIVDIPVFRKPRVAIIATGDEVVSADCDLPYGKVRNSNSVYLFHTLQGMGCDVIDFGIVKDDPAVLKETFTKALDSDIVISSGGVSVGDKDFVKQIWTELGYDEKFWRIAQRPGKPLLFGTKGKTLVFGLPGNPGAVTVCVEEYVKPAIRRMMQQPVPCLPETTAILETNLKKREGLVQFFRSKLEMRKNGFHVRPIGLQSSQSLSNMSQANAIIVSDASRSEIPAGESVRVQVLSSSGIFETTPCDNQQNDRVS